MRTLQKSLLNLPDQAKFGLNRLCVGTSELKELFQRFRLDYYSAAQNPTKENRMGIPSLQPFHLIAVLAIAATSSRHAHAFRYATALPLIIAYALSQPRRIGSGENNYSISQLP